MYPWVADEYIQADFHILNNVHLIRNNEDVNLGWQHYIQLGIETNDIANNQPVYPSINTNRLARSSAYSVD